ncbi:MAG: hypothetical protein ACD_16C00192G0011 [uncultured bacterium]|nr:MAG: hypothetical protein ACD_16C00192G0011 [uncultured bacterium]OFW68165.1 MAG: hypothetical protein A2X70_05670 [Alphaproteobacteria bacterium GWC2_42_16]OFW73558.1 MAG: hypothetical protein A2Z80_06970 [Alphaproteobacteria bacterium GWA2_41_27]OFW82407.1 MAG: hypothetical protein A3E50_04370 [Alphaproteobacteria bacterium RIFCSPHIGHO2_12_FULL_42_100]OFW86232.1 MAG: hypothetical protein A2W06_01300 [Alphaproteobacteria bacterium RBG_16_42_14]OFW91791.1 MAG: hypothetical protein A3C41_013
MTDLNTYFYPALAVIFFFIIYGYIVYIRQMREKEEKNRKKKLDQLVATPEEERKEALSLIKEQSPSDFFLQSKLQKVEGLRQWMQQAGLEISPFYFISLFSSFGVFLFVFLLLYYQINYLTSALIGVCASSFSAWAVLTFLRNRQKEAFLREFPIALDILRRALRAGFSTERALEMIADQQKGIIGKAFRRISDRMHLGESAEDVLADMSNRIGVDEFRMLSIVFVLQRETGGSLAEAAENLARIIRGREILREKVKSLTVEVRMTAFVLACLPFLSLTIIYISSPTYLDPLFTTEPGKFLLIIGSVLLATGITIILRMSYKDVY